MICLLCIKYVDSESAKRPNQLGTPSTNDDLHGDFMGISGMQWDIKGFSIRGRH